MTRTKSKSSSSRPRLNSHFKIEEVTMQPLNEALSNSRSGPSPPMAQPMMYHDLDLANIQREDNAEKNSSNRNNNAGKAQLEPRSVVEEITYPRVSHGKPPIQILLCNENESDHLGSIWHFSFSLIVYFRSTQHQYYIKRYKKTYRCP